LTPAGNFHKILTMKVFITGATGFIGSHLIDYYLSNYKNIEIFALVRNINNLKWLKSLKINFLEGNLFSIPPLPSDLNYIIHLAGLTLSSHMANYYTVNQQGTASLFQSISSQKISPQKIVVLSSLAAAGPSLDCQPIKENSSPQPITPYGMSKLKGEFEALKYREMLPLVILRAAGVFGPRDRDFLAYFKFIKKGILPSLSEQRQLSLCYVKDLVRAIDLSCQKNLESGEIINVADPQPYHWDEFGRAAGEALGKKLIKIKIPLPILTLTASFLEIIAHLRGQPSLLNRYRIRDMKVKCWIADVTKAWSLLSFKPSYALKEAIQETIAWYLNHNWL